MTRRILTLYRLVLQTVRELCPLSRKSLCEFNESPEPLIEDGSTNNNDTLVPLTEQDDPSFPSPSRVLAS